MRYHLERVGQEYILAKGESLSGHPLAQFIKNELPQAARVCLGRAGNGFHIKSTNLPGTWPVVPWLAFFHPTVGVSAQQGIYVVYLFDEVGRRVYLSLNQGATELQTALGLRESDVLLHERARVMRLRLPEYRVRFPLDEIVLGRGKLARGYERGHALGKGYDLDALPPEEEIRDDLITLIEAYRILLFRGGANAAEDDAEEGNGGFTIQERRLYRMHKKIERNSQAARLAKDHHGYTCQACNFNFQDTYGELGRDYIEAHHLVPLQQLAEGEVREYDVAVDFAVLCSNCHRMIHRQNDPGDLNGLRQRFRRRPEV